jgi:hypothetical protein
MFGSQAIEVAIGLVFVYLVLSLVCSAIKEGLAGALGMRARTLEEGMRNLLGHPETVQSFYDHPLVQGLMRGQSRPSYIPARTFVLALLDVIAPADAAGLKTVDDVRKAVASLPERIRRPLLIYTNDAGADLEKLRQHLEDWFNNSMERVSGWYKRRAQVILLVVALLVAAASNTDTLSIVNTLWNNATVRAALVQAAQETAKSAAPSTGAPAPTTATGAPPTTGTRSTDQTAAATPAPPSPNTLTAAELSAVQPLIGWSRVWLRGADSRSWVKKILGIVLTGVALSLGAPFWFDLLNKLVSLRSSGVKPEKKKKGT